MNGDVALGPSIPRDQAERRARRFWVSVIVFFLGLQVMIGGVSLYLATSDPSGAIVPNYHQAALDWDETRRKLVAANELGWSVELDISDVVDEQGNRALQVAIVDREGQSIDDLSVSASIYHLARAAQVATLPVPSIGNGTHQTLAPMRRSGRWRIDLRTEYGNRIIVVRREVWLP